MRFGFRFEIWFMYGESISHSIRSIFLFIAVLWTLKTLTELALFIYLFIYMQWRWQDGFSESESCMKCIFTLLQDRILTNHYSDIYVVCTKYITPSKHQIHIPKDIPCSEVFGWIEFFYRLLSYKYNQRAYGISTIRRYQ